MLLHLSKDYPDNFRRTRIRPVALPAEHGGWEFLLEPITIGLLLAPTITGLFLALSAVFTFLTRHPLKLSVGDRRKQRRLPRTRFADSFAILYLSLGVICFLAAIVTASQNVLLPILIAAPLAALQFSFDAIGRSRQVAAELAGAIAIAAISTAILIAGGWPLSLSFAVWLILAARNAPTILYVRTRLRLSRQKPAAVSLMIVAHAVAIAVAAILIWLGVAPYLAVLALTILLLRAVFVTKAANVMTPKKLGLLEIAFGVITVSAIVIGYAFGW